MSEVELAGAPLAYLVILTLTSAAAVLPLVRGLVRRGTGDSHAATFWIQRAPQFAALSVFSIVIVAFEAVEFELGTGAPTFGEDLFVRYADFLPAVSLALVLPDLAANIIAWLGVLWSTTGALLFVTGLYTLGNSFSSDAEILRDHRLCVSGPYRFVLHPIYAGYVHFLLGASTVVMAPIPAALTLALVAPLFLAPGRFEEKILRERFGEEYIELGNSLKWHRLLLVLVPRA